MNPNPLAINRKCNYFNSKSLVSTAEKRQEVEALRKKLNDMHNERQNMVEHIFYTSRTHSQLTQVINELNTNQYLMVRHGELRMFFSIWLLTGVEATSPRLLRMTILASKQVYCINEKIKSHPSLSVEDYCGRFVDIEDLNEKEGDLPNRMFECRISNF